MNEAGIFEEREIPSRSQPGKTYRMVRTAGGWQHADASCDGWTIREKCHHVEELNMTANGEGTSMALTVIERLEDRAIVEAVTGQITGAWVYSFRGSDGKPVTGLSIVGVENAARECAKRGEALRELDVRLEFENKREARFVAKAGRFGVMGDGSERLLDVAIRGCRISKYIRLTEEKARQRGVSEIPDDKWYEKGIGKAVRNAKNALIPEGIRSSILEEAERRGLIQSVDGSAGGTRTAAPRPQRAPRTTAPGNVSAEPQPIELPEGEAPEEAAESGPERAGFDYFLRTAKELKCPSRREAYQRIGLPANTADAQAAVEAEAAKLGVSPEWAWAILADCLRDIVKLAKKGRTWEEARGDVEPLAQLRRRAEEGRAKQEEMPLS